MSGTYQVKFSGKTIETTVTNDPAIAELWVVDVTSLYPGQKIIVGLDCEWRPHPIREMSNKTATLQLCVDTKCLILQLFYMDHIPDGVKDFLSNSNHVFVGVEVDQDASKLRDEYGLICTSLLDIRDKAMECGYVFYRKPGLKVLALRVAGLCMEKPKHVCRSNWDSRVLSFQQIEYACIDAYASYKIAHKLVKET